MKNNKVTDSIIYIGVNDKDIDLFENQYVVPTGITYNSYVILDDKIDLVIDTPSQGVGRSKDGFLIRRYAIETGVTCLTSLDTADALLTSLETGNRDQLTVVDIATI